MIISYTGRRGAGKTLTMMKDVIKYHHAGWRIYSNIEIKGIPHTLLTTEEIINISKDSEINNAVLVIDEIQIMFDSRRSGSKENKMFSNFIQQIRKRNIILLYTTQYSGTTDLRIRQHTDVVVRPRFNKKFLICDVVYYDLTATEDIVDLETPVHKRVVFDARQIFNIYDTNKTVV